MSSETTYQLRGTKQAENQEIVSFLDRVLPFPYDQRVFSWEYDHPNMIFCTVEGPNQEVLGSQGMIPHAIHSAGGIFLSAKSETSYLDQQLQGKGLFKKLYTLAVDECREKGIKHIWGFTALGPVWEKLGFQVQNECIEQYVIQLRVRDINQDQTPGLASKVKGFSKMLASLWLSSKSKRTQKRIQASYQHFERELNIREELASESQMKNLYKRIREQYPQLVHLEMDEYFMQNRIHENPFVQYRFRSVYDQDKNLQGYYVLAHQEGKHYAFLSDITAAKPEIKNWLIAKACEEARGIQEIKTLQIQGNGLNQLNREAFDCFQQFGALKYMNRVYIVSLVLDQTLNEEFNDFKNWYINGLWTEGVKQ
ncbi:MAG: GNAT family N-acetyltransferase [Bacteroidetes bacterium]|nr:MAG: GNAT family N-acetyltransferase [Bacteroidota bacterium]